jgi:hypothetical protein
MIDAKVVNLPMLNRMYRGDRRFIVIHGSPMHPDQRRTAQYLCGVSSMCKL